MRLIAVWVCLCASLALAEDAKKTIGHPMLGVTFELLARTDLPRKNLGDRPVGGISGLAYDPTHKQWIAISDDPRTHEALIDLNVELAQAIDGRFTLEVTPTRRWGIETGSRDGEAIAVAPDNGEIFVAYESDTSAYRYDEQREQAIELFVPDAVKQGARTNKSFESCTFRVTDMGDELWVATEEAIEPDGPIATTEHGSRCRVLTYDPITYALSVQAIYETEPVPRNIGGFAINSLSELCAMPNQRVLALERAFTAPAMHDIRLFVVTGGLTADKREPPTLEKLPIGSLRDLGVLFPGNIEAIECGPALADLGIEGGGFLFLLASDDNFGRYGETGTTFIALRARFFDVRKPMLPPDEGE